MPTVLTQKRVSGSAALIRHHPAHAECRIKADIVLALARRHCS
jgi:hypothetical protein